MSLLSTVAAPLGVAMSDAACGASVTVMLEGVLTFTGAQVYFNGSSSSSSSSYATVEELASMPIGTILGTGAGSAAGTGADAGQGGSGAVFLVTAVAAASRSGGSGSGSSDALSSEGDNHNGGPFRPGKAYYADTRGRLIEGSYAGAGGVALHGVQGGYITLVGSARSAGDTSVAYDGCIGFAISETQLLVRSC